MTTPPREWTDLIPPEPSVHFKPKERVVAENYPLSTLEREASEKILKKLKKLKDYYEITANSYEFSHGSGIGVSVTFRVTLKSKLDNNFTVMKFNVTDYTSW